MKFLDVALMQWTGWDLITFGVFVLGIQLCAAAIIFLVREILVHFLE